VICQVTVRGVPPTDNRLNKPIRGERIQGKEEGLAYIDDDKHVLVVLNQKPVAFYALLFGRIDGFIQLAERPIEGMGLPPGKGVAFVICCRTRRVASFDWEKFRTNQMIEKGWL
jgi:hypothetical protein